MPPHSIQPSVPGPLSENEWFALAVRTAPLPVEISCLNDGRFVEVNEAFLSLYGYTADEVIGHFPLELGLWTDQEARNMLVDSLIKGETVATRQVQYRTKSGKTGDLLISARKIEINKTAYLIGFHTDITRPAHEEKSSQSVQKRLETVLASQFQIVFHQDTDLRYTWIANPSFGLTEEEVVGRTDEELFGFKAAAPLVEVKKRVLATGQPERKEGWLTLNGETRGFDLQVMPDRDESGRVTGLICAAMDTTPARVRFEELNTTLDSIGDGFASLDKGCRFTYMNASCAKMLHLCREDIIGKGLLEVLPDIRDTPLETFLHQAAKGTANEFETYYEPLQRWFSACCYPRKDGGVSVYFLDITEQKRNQNKLAENESLLSLFIENAPVALVMLDRDLRCLKISGRGLHDFGLRGRDVRGLSYQEIFPDLPEIWKDDQIRGLSGEIVKCHEESLNLQDGSSRWVRREVRPWYTGGGDIGGIIIFSEDISARKEAESHIAEAMEELRKAEERLRYAMEAAKEGIWDWNLVTDHVCVSPAYATMLGYEPGVLSQDLMSTWIGLLHPEEVDRVVADAKRLLSEPGYYTIEFRLRRAQGDYIWISSHGKVVERDSEGKPLRAVGTHIDITDQKKAFKELERMHLLMKEGERIAHLGTWEYIIATQETVWSDEECRIYGLDPDAASPNYQTMLSQCIHHEDAERLNSTFQKALQDKALYENENRIVRPDGSVRLVRDIAYPYFDETGRLIKYIGTTLDITERRQLEESVKKIEAHLRSLIEGTIDAVYIKDLKGRYLLANSATAEFVGMKVEDIIGHDDMELLSPQDARIIMEQDHEIMAAKKVVALEEQVTRAGKVLRTCLTTKGPIYDSARNVVGLFGIARDITERKEAEIALQKARDQAMEASEAKSRFLATVSHVVRTPLASVMGLLEHITINPKDENVADWAYTAFDSSKRLQQILNDLLDSSSLHAPDISLECRQFSVRAVIGDVVQLITSEASAKQLKVVSQVAVDVPQLVCGDEHRIGQILLNLAFNAVKFTQQGSISIRVDIIERTDRETKLKFTVKDTGIGICAEEQERIFEPFVQVKHATTCIYGGIGLGLSICRSLTGLMSGEIGVVSQPDEGSTFWVMIPFRENLCQRT